MKEEDLAHPGVVRMILGQMDNLEKEVARLKTTEGNFYEADKDRAVYKEKLTAQTKLTAASALCFSLGGIIFGVMMPLWGVTVYSGPGLLIIAMLLMFAGYWTLR